MEHVKSVITCEAGGTHLLDYLGSKTQLYRCAKCGKTITKERLKKATEPSTVEVPPTGD